MNSVGALDVRGMHFRGVEDSWHVGNYLKEILESLGANVAGPAATALEVQGLIGEHTPDIAFVDVKLREGELAYDLIDYLHERGIRIIIISGSAVLPQRLQNVAAILQKPVSEIDLLTTIRLVTSDIQRRSGRMGIGKPNRDHDGS